ncbi:hypothetical protein R6Q57_013045 [Mikania cordata]
MLLLYGTRTKKPIPTSVSPQDITPKQPENGCYVITPSVSSPDYQIEFPSLTPFENTQQKAKHNWKVQSSIVVGPNGAFSSTTAVEATLNWQSENVVAQNQALKVILIQQTNLSKNQELLAGRVQTVESIINDVRSKIQELHYELFQMVRSTPISHASNALTNMEA